MSKARIGAYVRVSTSDKQTTTSQRHAVKEWARSNHVKTGDITYYEDKQTGKTTDRPALNRLLRQVERGKVDTVVVYSLSRLARNTREGLQVLADLGQKGIRVVSISEAIDFGNSVGNLLATILLAVAQFERETTVERIRAGMDAAKASGKHVGRPRNQKRIDRIAKMRQRGMSVNDIAEKLQCSRQAVYAALQKAA